jgi:hypothetical protein
MTNRGFSAAGNGSRTELPQVRRHGGVRVGATSALLATMVATLSTAACAPATTENGVEQPAPPQGVFATPTILAAGVAESPRAYGLTGANKPNGVVYRFRESVPPGTPAFVERTRDALDLEIADPVAGGWLAFYKGPLPEMPANADYHAVLYGTDGSVRWSLDLNRFLSADRHLEIQDIRLADGELYFNEACQTYSAEAGGACSALVRVDPESGTEVWRSRDLVSNNIFLPHGPFIVAGYGFTNEPDALHLVSRSTGRVLDTLPLESAHSYLEFKDGQLVVLTHDGALRVAIED